jgi:tRNA G18 (ribose-2'-O)-methylase SpoU
MPEIAIGHAGDPRVTLYRGVGEPALVGTAGRFIAEGRLVVRRLLESARVEAESVFVTPTARAALADLLETERPNLPVYVAPAAVLSEVAGFNIHRGCLALGRRPEPVALEAVVPTGEAPALILALDGVASADNVGGLFRCARAFGVDAVVVGPRCVDPFYRKAIRTSMGGVFEVPFVQAADLSATLVGLVEAGLDVVALSPDGEAANAWRGRGGVAPTRLVLVVGHEGHGLAASTRAVATSIVRVPMAPLADSLNVVAAAAIVLSQVASAMGRTL